MKKWQSTLIITLGTSAILWLFAATTNYYVFKARQEVLNENNFVDHKNIKEDIKSSRKVILHNLDKINKNILEIKDSIRETNNRVDKINTKLYNIDSRVKFIFKNTSELKKYNPIFSQNL